MSDFHDIRFTVVKLDRTRQRIVQQLTEIESSLSGVKKSSPKRTELLSRKHALLQQLREQKLRLVEARRIRATTPRDHAVTDHALVRWLERKYGVDVGGL